jgi:hypothetical protein
LMLEGTGGGGGGWSELEQVLPPSYTTLLHSLDDEVRIGAGARLRDQDGDED